jgi:hypothetical protein
MPLPGSYSSGTLPKTPLWRTADSSGAVETRAFPEAASQTFQVGELVGLNSSGQVINLGTKADPSAAGVSSSLVAGDLILGMALTSASNAASASATPNISVIVATGNVQYFLRIYNATATSAELQDVSIGDKAELFRYNGAGEIQTVLSDAPNGVDTINKVMVVEKPAGASATDQYPGVWVRVRSAYQALGGA